MLKEKNPLLNIKIKEEKVTIEEIIINIMESFFTLFDLILENPIDNFWYEFIGIIIGYSQILLYIFDKTVSLSKLLYIYIFEENIVLANME